MRFVCFGLSCQSLGPSGVKQKRKESQTTCLLLRMPETAIDRADVNFDGSSPCSWERNQDKVDLTLRRRNKEIMNTNIILTLVLYSFFATPVRYLYSRPVGQGSPPL
jgi:hypothetical protein